MSWRLDLRPEHLALLVDLFSIRLPTRTDWIALIEADRGGLGGRVVGWSGGWVRDGARVALLARTAITTWERVQGLVVIGQFGQQHTAAFRFTPRLFVTRGRQLLYGWTPRICILFCILFCS